MFLNSLLRNKDWYYITIASIAIFLSYSVGTHSFHNFIIFPEFIFPNPGDTLSVWSLLLAGWFLCRGVTITLNRFNKEITEPGLGIFRVPMVAMVAAGIIFLVWLIEGFFNGSGNNDLMDALSSLGIGIGILVALIIPKFLWRIMDKFDLSRNNILWKWFSYIEIIFFCFLILIIIDMGFFYF